MHRSLPIVRTTTSPVLIPIYLQRDAVALAYFDGIPVDQVMHVERSIQGTLGVVFESQGSAKQGHYAIAQDAIDCALKPMDCPHHKLETRIDQLFGFFGVETLHDVHGASDIGEENGDDFAFAFKSGLGRQNPVSKIVWRMVYRRLRALEWWVGMQDLGLSWQDWRGWLRIGKWCR